MCVLFRFSDLPTTVTPVTETKPGAPMGFLLNAQNGKGTTWSDDVKRNLTYSVGDGPHRKDIQRALQIASNDWSNACNVAFREVSEKDPNKIFRVEERNDLETVAISFFPSAPSDDRILQVCLKNDLDPWTLPGILRHELGHVLGFRHNHFEDNDFIKITDQYDSNSVMSYPHENFFPRAENDFRLTSGDIAAAVKVYGMPTNSNSPGKNSY